MMILLRHLASTPFLHRPLGLHRCSETFCRTNHAESRTDWRYSSFRKQNICFYVVDVVLRLCCDLLSNEMSKHIHDSTRPKLPIRIECQEKKMHHRICFHLSSNFIRFFSLHIFSSFKHYVRAAICESLRFDGRAGELMSPFNVQSASKIVRSVSAPKNLDDSSRSLIFNRTMAPRT